MGFLNLIFGWGGGQNCPPPTLTFVWEQLETWNFAQGNFNTIGFVWCIYIPCDVINFLMTSSEIWQVREISLKYANSEIIYNHGLKPGMHFFSSQKVNKQNITWCSRNKKVATMDIRQCWRQQKFENIWKHPGRCDKMFITFGQTGIYAWKLGKMRSKDKN